MFRLFSLILLILVMVVCGCEEGKENSKKGGDKKTSNFVGQIVEPFWSKEGYFDFTKKEWLALPPEKKFELTKFCQEWYAQKNNLEIERRVKVSNYFEQDIVMRLVPPGKFSVDLYNNGVEVITVDNPFWISNQITFAQWQAVTKEVPKIDVVMKGMVDYDGPMDAPVDQLSWVECKEFCAKVNMQLPSEAHLVYAWGERLPQKKAEKTNNYVNSWGLSFLEKDDYEWHSDRWERLDKWMRKQRVGGCTLRLVLGGKPAKRVPLKKVNAKEKKAPKIFMTKKEAKDFDFIPYFNQTAHNREILITSLYQRKVLSRCSQNLQNFKEDSKHNLFCPHTPEVAYPYLTTKELTKNLKYDVVVTYCLNHANYVPVHTTSGNHVYNKDNFKKLYEIQSLALKRVNIYSTFENGICKKNSKKKFHVVPGKLSEWKWYNPLPTDEDLNGVWGNSGKDVFVVGNKGIILRYNGLVWKQQDSGVWDDLLSVWSVGNHAFVVGKRGVILHYTGSSWVEMPKVVYNDLHCVWGSGTDDVFAVGTEGVILHYNGKTWSLMSKTIPNDLYSVWGSRKNNVIAVGKAGVILRYDGNSWDLDYSTNVDMYAAGGTSDSDIYAVGEGKIFYYNGNSWRSVPKGSSGHIGVWSKDKSNVFAIGNNYYRGYIAYYNGNLWQKIPFNSKNRLKAVWGGGNDVFFVGTTGKIAHYDYKTLTNMDEDHVMNSGSDFKHMWGSSETDLYLTEYYETKHYDGRKWEKVSATWFRGARNVWKNEPHTYVVGTSGIWRYNGKSWLELKIKGYNGTPVGVWGSSIKDVHIVDKYGIILHFNGIQWSGTRARGSLSAIWGNSHDNVFAVGDNVFHYNGKRWSEMLIRDNQSSLYSVWGSSRDNVFAVGNGVFHYNGKKWRKAFNLDNQRFYTIWGTASDNIFVGGDNGVIIHYNGKQWTEMITHTHKKITKIWELSDNKLFAIGDDGLMLQFYKFTQRKKGTRINVKGVAKSIAQLMIKVKIKGVVKELTPVQTKVKKGDTLAVLVPDKSKIANNKQQLQQKRKRLNELKSNKDKMEKKLVKDLANYKKKYGKQIALKDLEGQKITRTILRKFTRKYGYRSIKLLQSYRELDSCDKAIQKQQNIVNTLTKEITELVNVADKINIISPANGIVREWKIDENANVLQDESICLLDDISKVKYDILVVEADALNWKKGDIVTLNFTNSAIKVNAVVDFLEKNLKTLPQSLWLHLLIDNDDNTIVPGMEANFHYTKE